MVPKKRQRHHSYEEDTDEPPTLIESEAIEVEAEVPAEENEPIERTEPDDANAGAFDEE